MHDPQSVAFDIYLGPKKNRKGRYRSPFITIWHVDPETDGSDNSCGWFGPKITSDELIWLKEIAKEQYCQIYAKRDAIQKEESYAYICYNQDILGCIYWIWRVFNRGKVKWQYGKHVSNKEWQYIYQLATNPVDNFQSYKSRTLEEFEGFVLAVYRCYRAYKRPWYKHPRWHIHHWKIQFHPFQQLKRRFWDKCSVCGKRGFKGAAISDFGGKRMWHEECNQIKLSPKPLND